MGGSEFKSPSESRGSEIAADEKVIEDGTDETIEC